MTGYLIPIAILQTITMQLATSSVIPKPIYKIQQSTTQITNVDKNYSGEGTIIIVTSSELPKQIPPPPTPTKPHGATPKYETQWVTKEPFYGDFTNEKHTVASYHMPYNALERAEVYQNLI